MWKTWKFWAYVIILIQKFVTFVGSKFTNFSSKFTYFDFKLASFDSKFTNFDSKLLIFFYQKSHYKNGILNPKLSIFITKPSFSCASISIIFGLLWDTFRWMTRTQSERPVVFLHNLYIIKIINYCQGSTWSPQKSNLSGKSRFLVVDQPSVDPSLVFLSVSSKVTIVDIGIPDKTDMKSDIRTALECGNILE